MTRRLSYIGRDLQSRIKMFFDAPLDGDATPLEICQAALDDIERKLEPVGRGRRVFPYTRVLVRLRQPKAERAALDAAFAGFDSRLRERLAELRCEPARTLDVKVVVLKKPPAEWAPDQLFAIEYRTPHDAEEGSSAPPVHITIVKGAAARKVYSFTEPLISIGRTPDPTDVVGRVRRNRVVFLDTVDGVTETVGRAHAHLRFDAQAREYRLFDDGSSNGTSVVRDGAAIPVPPRDPRGVRVCSGDEAHVGRAVIRIVIGPGC
jgi:hypothetical protein